MLRNLTKIGHKLANLSQLHRYGLPGINSSRHFSGDLSADWPESIKTFLRAEKISMPTLIQEKTLPIAMNNKDLVGIARTGSGKTLAFVIPAVLKIMKEQENKGEAGRKSEKAPSCVIIAPTRELAEQTADVFKKFTKFGVDYIVCADEPLKSDQDRDLSYKDHDVYIATPGRLKDLVDAQVVDLSQVKYLVLDEADRMLDMGFEPQIRDLISHMPKKRQTLMWSSIWSKELQDIAGSFMTNYEKVTVESSSGYTLKKRETVKEKGAVKFTTSQANVDYRATLNFYGDTQDVPPTHNVVLALTGIFAIFYLIFIRDDGENDGGKALIKPLHETIPGLAIPFIKSAIAENKKFGLSTYKLEKKLEELMKEPEKYGGHVLYEPKKVVAK